MFRNHPLGPLVILCLVGLRLVTGWHFYKEGIKKYKDPDFTSKYFLIESKGPLAPLFHDLIPDRFGTATLDRKATIAKWQDYQSRLAKAFGFDDQQQAAAKKEFAGRRQQLNKYLDGLGPDLEEHFLEVERWREASRQPVASVAFQTQRLWEQEKALTQKSAGWVKGVQAISADFQADLIGLAKKGQRAAITPLVPASSKTWVDHAVTGVTVGVGVLLLLGLFTRLASLVGAGFLCSVLATQPFWAAGAELSYAYYQLVEVFVLLLLAATRAGRFWGLDFFVSNLWAKYRPSVRREVNDELNS